MIRSGARPGPARSWLENARRPHPRPAHSSGMTVPGLPARHPRGNRGTAPREVDPAPSRAAAQRPTPRLPARRAVPPPDSRPPNAASGRRSGICRSGSERRGECGEICTVPRCGPAPCQPASSSSSSKGSRSITSKPLSVTMPIRSSWKAPTP